MKFFTMNWWSGGQDWRQRSADPGASYTRHVEALAGRLPPSFAQLNSEISLHDARMLTMAFDVSRGAISMSLAGLDESGGARRFEIEYQGVSRFVSTADPDTGLPGPHGYGDLGYDETDVDDAGLLVHRILFSSGIEFEVTFEKFSIEWFDEGR